jgi:hypothetical protein
MDVVYICRDGENEELRYSIRSVEKNLPHSNVWVVGGKPRWYSGKYIKVPQNRSKFQNAKANMQVISESKDISDDFILMNDDFFILKPVHEVKYYYSGSLSEKIEYYEETHPRSKYTDLLKKSMKTLQLNGVSDPKDYALHVPFIMNKEKLREVLRMDISWRLAYGNIHKVGGDRVKVFSANNRDVKVYMKNGSMTDFSKNSISDTYLSSNDDSFEHIRIMLQKLFPEPSRFEKLDARTRSLSNNEPKVCIFSNKNATWNNVGKVYRGHNLVTQQQADFWIKKHFIRMSTEEEAVKEFGKNYNKLKFDGFGKYNP